MCSRNRLRSPTAETLFSQKLGIEAASAGTSPDADTLISAELVEWADLALVMEGVHRHKLNARFGSLLKAKQVIVLGIPDRYRYMDPDLVQILRRKVTPFLR